MSNNEDQTTNSEHVEIVQADQLDSSALAILTKAEIDVAISTAKRYPRDLIKVKKDIALMAAADQETAEACFFSLPRQKYNEKTKAYEDIDIEGEGIRLAEIVAANFGNIKTGKRIIGIDRINKKITAQAIVLDLERNVQTSVEETRNICGKSGKIYSEDMIVMTGKAAQSVALRNAIFNVIPKAMIKSILKEIKQVASGEKRGYMVEEKDFVKKPLTERVHTAMNFFKNWGVSEARVLALLHVDTVDEITEEGLQRLTGIRSGINQGEFTIDAAIPLTDVDKSKEVGKEIMEKVNKNLEGQGSLVGGKVGGQLDPSKIPAEDLEEKPKPKK
jgi:hypothetical protein